MARFVRPDTATLKTASGDTLVVKRRLNAGERRRMFAAMAVEDNGKGKDSGVRLNPFQYGITTILAYLLDWSVCDSDGKPVVIREKPKAEVEKILDELDPDDFGEILKAIQAHEEAMDAEREAEKNAPEVAGETPSPVTSPSLVV